VATVTLIAGALVTSKNAGMAFRDWPTSDGQFMLTYPWLGDFARNWDKFLEHGHRLAGMLIGMWAIALVVVTTKFQSRRSVKWLARAVLIGVIFQGILGGFRVQLDARGLAMLHGAFAAVVLSLMGVTATMLSPGWPSGRLSSEPCSKPSPGGEDVERLPGARALAYVTSGLLALQFLLGGEIRHFGSHLHEHLGLGILAFLAIIATAIAAFRTGESWLRRSGIALLLVGLTQVSLGAAAWITKFGLASMGYVAVADSIVQVASRSAHTVVGVLLIMTSVAHAIRTHRVCVLRNVDRRLATVPSSAELIGHGGAA
jgi:cytochrome c oxidase assembly protein subunit 15